MRSFILTAAIAAALFSTSLTAGYAASPGKGGASSGGPALMPRDRKVLLQAELLQPERIEPSSTQEHRSGEGPKRVTLCRP